MKLSLFQRLFLLVGASVAVVTLTLVVGFYFNARQLALHELEQRGQLLARGLAEQSVQGLETENVFHTLEPLVAHTLKQPDVTFAGVETAQKKELASGGSAGTGAGVSFTETTTKSGSGIGMFDEGAGEQQTLGRVTVTLSLSSFQRQVRRVALLALLAALLSNLLAMGPALLTARWLARRVGAAAEAAHQVGLGDYAVRLGAEEDDELGALARGFNSMVDALGVSRSQLEAKVVEVTQTLGLLKQTQGQLLHSEKIAAVGQLAGGVAHDFNNLLTVILFSGRSLEQNLPEGDVNREDAVEIVQAAKRAADLTRQLLAFSRRQTLEPRIVDVNDAVAGMEKMLRRLIGEDIQLSFLPGPKEPTIRIDAGQFEQVVMNLVVNARDALPEGGKIRIETTRGKIPEGAGVLQRTSAGDDWVILSVTDNGIGMSEETRARIFEPFFTTKGVGKGTGLGLSTVYGIIEQSGGQISVVSRLGKGTTFSIYLPPQVDEEEVAAGLATALAPIHSGTILLVEDEDQIRHITARLLRKSGYEVIEMASPIEALKLAEQHKREIDLLLTDVTMPLMNGVELAKRIRPLQPSTPVLYMSGYTDRKNLETISSDPRHFMSKPFEPEQLLAKVRDLLETATADAR